MGNLLMICRILTEPETNQIKQHMELLATEGVKLQFSDTAIKSIAQIAADVNMQVHSLYFMAASNLNLLY